MAFRCRDGPCVLMMVDTGSIHACWLSATSDGGDAPELGEGFARTMRGLGISLVGRPPGGLNVSRANAAPLTTPLTTRRVCVCEGVGIGGG